MGTVERREREKAELRQRILDAARELFVIEGYEAVSMRKIAERIEYSATAIYSYFEDKAALLRALCDHDFGVLAQEFVSIASIADPEQRLRESGRAYVRFALAHPNQYQLMFMTPLPALDPAGSMHEKGNPSSDAYAFLQHSVQEMIANGGMRADLTDVELVSQALWSSLHGIVALHITRKDDPWVQWRDAEATAEVVMSGLLGGLARDPRAARKAEHAHKPKKPAAKKTAASKPTVNKAKNPTRR